MKPDCENETRNGFPPKRGNPFPVRETGLNPTRHGEAAGDRQQAGQAPGTGSAGPDNS